MTTIKIPNSLKGKDSPYLMLYKHIAKKLGKKLGCKLNESAVSVSPKTGKKLKNMEYSYFKKTKPNWISKMAFFWHWLDYSPVEREDIRNGYAEVDETKYFVEVDNAR